MKNISYWLDMPYTPRPSLSQDIETDVVVIGGGITGISVAFHTAKQGMKTVLIEKETICSGSAGRNGGMVVEGLALDLLEAIQEFGIEDAKKLWTDTITASDYITALVKEYSIDCDVEKTGSLYLGFTDEDTTKLRGEALARESIGADCEIVEIGKQLKPSPFKIELHNAKDYALHPVKFIRGLAKAAEDLGLIIYENTPAITWSKNNVITANGKITAKKVILALESGTMPLPPNSTTLRSQALVFEPLSEDKFKEMDWQFGDMFWTTGESYISGRRIGNRIFTCKKLPLIPSEEERDQNMDWQIEKIISFFPTLSREDLVVSHRWNGLMIETQNYRPYIREVDECVEICGHGGNGLTFGILAGKMVARYLGGAEIPPVYRY